MNSIFQKFNSKTIALLGILEKNDTTHESNVLFRGTCFKIYQNYYLTCFHVLDLSKKMVISFPNEIDGFLILKRSNHSNASILE